MATLSDMKTHFIKEFNASWFDDVNAKIRKEKSGLFSKNCERQKIDSSAVEGCTHYKGQQFSSLWLEILDSNPKEIPVHSDLVSEFDAFIELVSQFENDKVKCQTCVRKILNASFSLGDVKALSPSELWKFFENLFTAPDSLLVPTLSYTQTRMFKEENADALNALKEYKFKTELLYF